MAAMMLLYDQLAPLATLAGGSWAVPLTALQDPRPRVRARSVDLNAASTQFRVALPAPASFKAVALIGTNLSADATYRITAYADANFSDVIETTGVVAIAGHPGIAPDGAGVPLVHVFDPPSASARWWKWELIDAANGDGHVEAGVLVMSACWQPPHSFSEDNQDAAESRTTVEQTIGGTRYYNRRAQQRIVDVAFEVLPGTELAQLARIRRLCGIDKPVLFIPDPEDAANFGERCLYGTLRTLPPIRRLKAGHLATGFSVIESL